MFFSGSRYIRLTAISGSVALLALQVALIARGWDYYQYDFRAYYIGAALFAENQDPYSFEALQNYRQGLGLRPNDHRFLYAPYMLWVFTPLAVLPYSVAFFVWLILQLLATTVTVFLTLRHLRPDPIVFMLLVAVGLNGTVAAVLRTGQITLITLALVLGALAFIAIRRAISATVLLLLAAMPKLWLAPMLTLLIHRFDASRIALMLIGLGAVVGLMSLSAFVHPQFYEAFTETMRDFALRERSIGPENGSLQNLSITFFLSTGGSLQEARNWWAGSTLAITAVATVRFFQAIRSDRVELAYLFSLIALSLCLVSPRVMIYQWSIALPALAYVITYMRNRTCAHIILLFALVPTIYINRYVFGMDTFERIENPLAIPWAFSNLLVVTLAWFALIVMWPRRTQATGLM